MIILLYILLGMVLMLNIGVLIAHISDKITTPQTFALAITITLFIATVMFLFLTN